LIAERRWTLAEAAPALRVTWPRISHLIQTKIDRFSIETLMHLLFRAAPR